MAELERVMEDKLVHQLTTGISQWTYRDDIRTDHDLWQNFRDKLEQNNQAALDGHPITDAEFEQIRQFMLDVAETPYKAGEWLSGEHGIAQIPLVREDASLGSIHLNALNNREVAGGRSSYEVIRQFISNKIPEDSLDRKRRFDVTLLINGMPMIQIELKNRAHQYMEAFRQIQKYGSQCHFGGLYGLVQMFVVTNGANTRYIAADVPDALNETFLTSWVDKDNNPVEDYLHFAKEVLSVPAAHYMVGKYSILDSSKKKIILLRPYQVHAVEAIKEASRKHQSGFVWHTTGSGKTLTSYNVTKNLLDLPWLDKTIFLIDRKALDTQTTTDFQSYAEHDDIDVDETNNTHELEQKLMSKDRSAIITTIQKLQTIIRKCTDEEEEPTAYVKKMNARLRDLHIAFVVDECHRTVSPKTKRILERFFRQSQWYGFTGTPIFDENKRGVQGNLPRTTEELYGPLLHSYTIKEAIKNHAVLGFLIQYADNLNDEEVRELAAQLGYGSSPSDPYDAERDKLEAFIMDAYKHRNRRNFYDDPEEHHKMEVIDHIVNHADGQFLLGKGEGNTYEAILTVDSIKEAQRYYSLFKQFIADGKVSERIRRKLPDFPKIAITYTVGENEDGAQANQALMKESLADYNRMFGTKFTMEEGLKAYNTNLNTRLARKESRYKVRKEQLDLVIVVDRLLTGFDAPCLATLFVDRAPLKPQNLIQAFSRTNRIYEKSKRYGQVVIFQTPATYKKAITDALVLYSHGGNPNEVVAPTYKEAKQVFMGALKELRQVAPKPEDADELADRDEKIKFAKAYQQFDRALASLEVYDEFRPELLKTCGLSTEIIDEYMGKYQNTVEELKNPSTDDTGDTEPVPIDIDVEYELETGNAITINYRYLVSLIQKYFPEGDEAFFTAVEDKNIDHYIDDMAKTNPQVASVIRNLWEDLKAHPEKYRGKRAVQIIDDRIDDMIHSRISELARKWHVQEKDIRFYAYHFNPDDKMDLQMDYDGYLASGGTLSKLKYRKAARTDIAEAIAKDIRPLLRR